MVFFSLVVLHLTLLYLLPEGTNVNTVLAVGVVVQNGGGFAVDPAVADALQGGHLGPSDPLCRTLGDMPNLHSVNTAAVGAF